MLSERWRLFLAAALCVPLGLATKTTWFMSTYPWLGGGLGGAIYVMFFVFLALAVRPNWSTFRVVLIVFLVTCAIEFLQLYKTEFLTNLRSNRLGALFLGSTFAWQDFVFYILGAVSSRFLASTLKRR